MSSMVCQGLQSCLEPRFVEPQGLGLKLAPPKPIFSRTMEWATRKSCTSDSDSDTEEQNINNNLNHNNNNDENTNIDINKSIEGWSLIQALTNSTQISPIQEKEETPYVHPLVKRYSSKLSEKSLELCTENLGSETGTDISDYSDISSSNSSDSEGGKSPTRDRVKSRHNWGTINKKVNYGSLPPPLTSISGANSVQIRPHREGGRLVIKTVVIPTTQTYFQAERRDGRLRLHFVKNCDSCCRTLDSKFEKVIQEEKCGDKKEEEQEIENENENEEEQEEESENEYEEELDQEADVENDYLDEDMEGNNDNDGSEMGIEKFQRPSRCKENGQGKNGLLIWEPFWVAT